MDVVVALERLGGVGTTAQLRALCGRKRLARAVAEGRVLRLGRGRFALSDAQRDRRRAVELAGVTSHLSAAQHHGWKVKVPPSQAWITVPRNRKLPKSVRDEATVRYADLRPDEVESGVTTPLRTVVDCARALPFDEALTVADSALRAGDITLDDLRAVAAGLRGNGAGAVRRVARHADGRSANPLESVLRAIAVELGLGVVPQHAIADTGLFAVVDVAVPDLRLVLEAEGFEFHGSREQWRNDCRRFTRLAAHRWWVLRFTWEDVMHHPQHVRWAIETWLRAPQRAVVGLAG
jgi:very-short-patch-repair endonuclease